MEKTELREAFFAEVRNDPYANAVMHLVTDAWVDGYEQALRDHGLTDERLRKSHSERRNEAVERLTDRRNEASAKAIIAFAQMGRDLGEPRLPNV